MDSQHNNGSVASPLGPGAQASVLYHDIFDFPLNSAELIKWEVGKAHCPSFSKDLVEFRKGYYSVIGRKGLRLGRLLRSRTSAAKKKQALKAASALAVLPTIKMVALTGALAMNNAETSSDIDFFIITKAGKVWTSRLMALFWLMFRGFNIRRYGDKNEKDKLCLNMWLDEGSLSWPTKDRNIYTAHEIAQILPLVNKDNAYEEFLAQNSWAKEYWPNAVRITRKPKRRRTKEPLGFFEKLTYWIQYKYMKGKITREIVTERKAVFHPRDWGSIVSRKLKGLGFRA
jgi:hypothetical protein